MTVIFDINYKPNWSQALEVGITKFVKVVILNVSSVKSVGLLRLLSGGETCNT